MRWIERALTNSIANGLAKAAAAEVPDDMETFARLPQVIQGRLRRTIVAVAAHRAINLIAAAGFEQADVQGLLEKGSPTQDPRQLYALKECIGNALRLLSWEDDERRALEFVRKTIERRIIN